MAPAPRRPAAAALLVALLLAGVPSVRALYFYMGETEKRCFIEEVPDATIVVGKYRLETMGPPPPPSAPQQHQRGIPSGVHISVKDPGGDVLVDKVFGTDGRFMFTSHEPGEHVVCLSTNSTLWFGGKRLVRAARVALALRRRGRLRATPTVAAPQKVHLSLEMGEGAVDYEVVQRQEHLTALQIRILQLIEQCEQIIKEQAYQRVREARYREISDATNSRVFWWTLLQAAVLVAASVWQMRHLKAFFEAKKLV